MSWNSSTSPQKDSITEKNGQLVYHDAVKGTSEVIQGGARVV